MNKELLLIMFILSCVDFRSSEGFTLLTTSPGQTSRPQEENKAAHTVPWIEFAPKGGGFAILFPGTPTEEVDSFQHGSLTLPSHMYSFKVGDVTYFVVRLGDVPERPDSSTFIDDIFNNAYKIFFEYTTKDGKKEITKFTNQRELSLAGRPGLHYETDCGPHKDTNSGSCIAILRVYKSGRSIFVVGLTGPKSILTVDHVERFLRSFSII